TASSGSFDRSRDPRALYSFPTRRSSDLVARADDLDSDAMELLQQLAALDEGAEDEIGQRAVLVEQPSELFAIDRDVAHRLRRDRDRKSTRLNSSHVASSYAVFCLKKKRR